jgi:Flp pilus assembly protein TadB
MKTYFYSCLMSLFAMLAFAPVNALRAATASANSLAVSTTVKTEKKGLSGWIEKKAEKMVAKKIAKLQKRFADGKADFSDPVKKWLWFGIVFCAAGLLLGVLAAASGGIFWGLSGLAWTLGVVCLIVWFLKKEGAIRIKA